MRRSAPRCSGTSTAGSRLMPRRGTRGFAGTSRAVLLLVLLWAPSPGSHAEDPTPKEGEDWASIVAQLSADVSRRPADGALRRQLAIAHNNHAVVLADQGHVEVARQHLENALRLEPSNPQFRVNLAAIHVRSAQAAYDARRLREARTALKRALDLDATMTGAYVLLGRVEYETQHLREAQAAWEQALRLDSALEDVREQLARVRQELPVESQLERVARASFDVRYPDDLSRVTGFDISNILVEARRGVGADFSYWTQRTIVVLVYREEQFRQVRQERPEWLAGEYDGKIRVPWPGTQYDEVAVRRILVHEFTHALLHELANNRLPTWFNEGLAEYQAWKGQTPPWTALRAARHAGRLAAWDELTRDFSLAVPVERLTLLYEQSHSIVCYLVERYGFWRLRRLVAAVGDETPLADAMSREFHLPVGQLEANWRHWLDQRLG